MYHDIAIKIEHRLRKFGDNDVRCTLLGIADADFIEHHPLAALCVYYSCLYNSSHNTDNKNKMSHLVDELAVTIGNNAFGNIDLENIGFSSDDIEDFEIENGVQNFLESVIKQMDNCFSLIQNEYVECFRNKFPQT